MIIPTKNSMPPHRKIQFTKQKASSTLLILSKSLYQLTSQEPERVHNGNLIGTQPNQVHDKKPWNTKSTQHLMLMSVTKKSCMLFTMILTCESRIPSCTMPKSRQNKYGNLSFTFILTSSSVFQNCQFGGYLK